MSGFVDSLSIYSVALLTKEVISIIKEGYYSKKETIVCRKKTLEKSYNLEKIPARDNWIGRLAMNTSENTTKAYDFFLREMPKFGWQEITTVRSDISIIMFRRGNRIVTVQIKGQTLGGSTIDVTVSPARDSQQIPKTSMGPSQSTQ